MGVIVDSRQEHETRTDRGGKPRVLPLLAMTAGLLGLISLTVQPEPSVDPLETSRLVIPDSVDTVAPRQYEGGSWVETGVATGNVLGATRIPGGYAFPARDGVVVLLDSGDAVRSQLPDLRVQRGIAADSERVVVYGTAEAPRDRFPTLWESSDGLTWTTRSVPWQGAIQTVTFDRSRMLVAGIRAGGDGLVGVVARETDIGGWDVTTRPIPTSALYAIDGGFVVRSRQPGNSDYLLYSTTDFERFEYFADSMLVSAPGLSAGIVEVDGRPALRVDGRDEPLLPPDWPVASLWLEGPRIWIQTPTSLWTSLDGAGWSEIRLDRSAWLGPAMAIPVGDTARVAVSEPGNLTRIYEWRLP